MSANIIQRFYKTTVIGDGYVIRLLGTLLGTLKFNLQMQQA